VFGVDVVGTIIAEYLVPLHRRYCIDEVTSNKRTRGLFYLLVLAISFSLTHVPSLLMHWLPMSKPLWTIPFVLQTTGITLLSWLLATHVDTHPSIRFTNFLEVLGQRSLEVYLVAEILQEFVMFPGKRRGGGTWEGVVGVLQAFGVGRSWACLLVSLGWAWVFTGFAYILKGLGWRLKL
jgi:predicted acyltransferase